MNLAFWVLGSGVGPRFFRAQGHRCQKRDEKRKKKSSMLTSAGRVEVDYTAGAACHSSFK